jgi:hypothetical protein
MYLLYARQFIGAGETVVSKIYGGSALKANLLVGDDRKKKVKQWLFQKVRSTIKNTI